MLYISIERDFYSASARIYCIKTHSEMADKLKLRIDVYLFIGALVNFEIHYLFDLHCNNTANFCYKLVTFLYCRSSGPRKFSCKLCALS